MTKISIEELFGISIECKKGRGYHIADNYDGAIADYEELLMNFDLLTSVSDEADASLYLLPEHHRPKGSENIPVLIRGIKECCEVEFEYRNVRKGNEPYRRRVRPYFIKQSQGLWYLICLDSKSRVRCFGIDRMTEIQLTDLKFKRNDAIKPTEMFVHSYGIWDDPAMPVETVELSYSSLDGQFLKANPLHKSQTILADNDEEFRIRLNIRVTNDFVMALLSRSESLTVIAPLSLRERIKDVYARALQRNS